MLHPTWPVFKSDEEKWVDNAEHAIYNSSNDICSYQNYYFIIIFLRLFTFFPAPTFFFFSFFALDVGIWQLIIAAHALLDRIIVYNIFLYFFFRFSALLDPVAGSGSKGKCEQDRFFCCCCLAVVYSWEFSWYHLPTTSKGTLVAAMVAVVGYMNVLLTAACRGGEWVGRWCDMITP